VWLGNFIIVQTSQSMLTQTWGVWSCCWSNTQHIYSKIRIKSLVQWIHKSVTGLFIIINYSVLYIIVIHFLQQSVQCCTTVTEVTTSLGDVNFSAQLQFYGPTTICGAHHWPKHCYATYSYIFSPFMSS
jgi:hypothetical protein